MFGVHFFYFNAFIHELGQIFIKRIFNKSHSVT